MQMNIDSGIPALL